MYIYIYMCVTSMRSSSLWENPLDGKAFFLHALAGLAVVLLSAFCAATVIH